jgi:hypothetical protein
VARSAKITLSEMVRHGCFEFFSGNIGNADGLLLLIGRYASALCYIPARKRGNPLFHMIASPIKLLQQFSHAPNGARDVGWVLEKN